MEKLEIITIKTVYNYKFPLLINRQKERFQLPLAFVREALGKKFTSLKDDFDLDLNFFNEFKKMKTTKKEEHKNLIQGLTMVLNVLTRIGFDKAVEYFGNRSDAIYGAGGNGSPNDKSSATGIGKVQPLLTNILGEPSESFKSNRKPVVFSIEKTQPLSKSIYNSSVYPTLPPLNVDAIIQMKESEVYELHKKVMDFEKLKAENDTLKLKCHDLETDCQLKDSVIESWEQINNIKQGKIDDLKEEIEAKTKNIDCLANSVNRMAKELELIKILLEVW